MPSKKFAYTIINAEVGFDQEQLSVIFSAFKEYEKAMVDMVEESLLIHPDYRQKWWAEHVNPLIQDIKQNAKRMVKE
jgi:hypothetical protein